jgi:hypothetical protein
MKPPQIVIDTNVFVALTAKEFLQEIGELS